MGAPADTRLTTNLRFNFSTNYKRTDLPLATVEDKISYSDINHNWANGRGADKANLQFKVRVTLNNEVISYDLDGGVTDVWGNTLNYDAIKLIVIRNRETAANRFLEVQFKNEFYYIGPGGARILVEPTGNGLEGVASSGSSEEGNLTLSSDSQVSADLFIIGSDKESSSSSGA